MRLSTAPPTSAAALYDGKRGGWHASRIAMQAVGGFPARSGGARAAPRTADRARISAAFRACYARHGILEIARGDPARRFGATLTLAADLGETFRFVLIGDSGLRINGAELFINDTGLDLVTASLRVEAYRLVGEAGGGSRRSCAGRPRVRVLRRGDASSGHAALARRGEAPAAVRTQPRLVPRALPDGARSRYPASARHGHQRTGAVREQHDEPVQLRRARRFRDSVCRWCT